MVFLMAGGGLGGDVKQLDNRLLEQLQGVLADVGVVDPGALDCRDSDALGLALLGASQQLAAHALRLVGSSQAAGFPEFAGFVNNTRHIAVGAGMSNHNATELAALAAFITNHRLIAQAVAAGTLDIAQVRCLATAAQRRQHRFTQDLPGLLHNVIGLSFDGFSQRIQSWRLNTDPDDPEEPSDTEAGFNGRSLKMQKRLDGSSQGTFTLDAHATLLLEELFDSTTPDSANTPVPRTTDQRHADTLTEAIELFLNGGDHGPTKQVIDIVWNLDPLATDTLVAAHGRLLNGTDLIPHDILELLACDSDRRLIIRHGNQILNVGDAKAELTPKQKLAVRTRDVGCQFQGCDRKGAWSHIHHIKWRSHGGGNQVDNLVLLCGHHHRLVHHTPWDIRWDKAAGAFETYWNGPTRKRLSPEDLSRWKNQLNQARSKPIPT